MGLIKRYIFRHVATSTSLVTAVLTTIIWLTQSLRSLDLVISHGASVGGLFYLILLLLPDIISILLPISLFISVLLVIHRLQQDHEIVILGALGISPWQITRPILAAAATCMVILYAINLYFLPLSFQRFKDLQFSYRNQQQTLLIQEGEFINFSNITVYTKERDIDGEIRGVFIHDGRNPENPVVLTARSGKLIDTPTGPRIVLVEGTRQSYENKTKGFSFLTFDQYVHELRQPQETKINRQKNPSEYFVWELFGDHPEHGRDETQRLRAEGYRRLLTPFFPLLFALIAMAILLHAPHHRVHRSGPFGGAAACVIATQILITGFFHHAGTRPLFILFAYLVLTFSLMGASFVFWMHARPRARGEI